MRPCAADHDGKLTKEELATFLREINLDAVAVTNLLQVADVTHDGKLCLEEFSTMIQAEGRRPSRVPFTPKV